MFTIKLRPDGKYSLEEGNVPHGVYESLEQAKIAMQRVIVPIVYHYKSNGEEYV